MPKKRIARHQQSTPRVIVRAIGDIPGIVQPPKDLSMVEQMGLSPRNIVPDYCKLVDRFIAGKIDYKEFRSRMRSLR